MFVKNKKNTLELFRIYDASVKDVWDAWTDPKKVAKWWGPRGFSITTHSKDLKAGGHWNYTMHGPDGVDYKNITKYHVVEKYSKLVYDHGGNEDQPPLFQVEVTFSEKNGKTSMAMSMTFESEQKTIELKKFIKAAGGNATWDRLGEFLAHESTGKEYFFINRTFDCSLEQIYDLWTNPKHFSKWLAPTGFEMEFIRADIAPGGKTFYFMGNGSLKMYGRAHYKEVVKNSRLVYTQQFCDEKENVSRHPMAPTWPETMLTTVTFNSESPTQTRVTIQWEPYDQFTPEELDTFIKGKAGMTLGWTGSFDKLEDYIPTVQF